MSESCTFEIPGPPVPKPVICELCGCETPRRGSYQKYCVECSTKRDLQRKRLWAKGHYQPPSEDELKAIWQRNHAARIQAGMEFSDGRGIAWVGHEEPRLAWIVRIAIPFDYAISKNHMWAHSRKGHVYLRKEHSAKRDEIIWMFRAALKDHSIRQNRLWLDILVQKDNHRGDAINVLDAVSDAIKEATGLDDRWYSVRRLDWEVVKESPQIFIGIGQEECEDAQVCAYCGRVLPFDAFGKNRSAKTGRARACRECVSAANKANRRRKA